MSNPCPFCSAPNHRIVAENALALVLRDLYPVSPGHTLIIPRRHVGSFFELNGDERQAIFELLARQKVALEQEFRPDSWNIGINDGPEAGQTVPHCHLHLIPRYRGDVEDPRGGVRWVIRKLARYWP